MITLVEQTKINRKNSLFRDLDHLCFLSKNLYNATLYRVRQFFFETKGFLTSSEVNKQMISEKNPDKWGYCYGYSRCFSETIYCSGA